MASRLAMGSHYTNQELLVLCTANLQNLFDSEKSFFFCGGPPHYHANFLSELKEVVKKIEEKSPP